MTFLSTKIKSKCAFVLCALIVFLSSCDMFNALQESYSEEAIIGDYHTSFYARYCYVETCNLEKFFTTNNSGDEKSFIIKEARAWGNGVITINFPERSITDLKLKYSCSAHGSPVPQVNVFVNYRENGFKVSEASYHGMVGTYHINTTKT
ncbi:MAG: hypothetical protein IJ191_02545 [Treponema sp.]|nr:hypothetical protein [Treponema sp.]